MLKLKKWANEHQKIVIIFGILALVILPLPFDSNYIRGVLGRIMLYAAIASGLNIINGYSGQSCLGIVGFTCIGAYCTGILATRFGLQFIPCLLASTLFCAVVSFFVSLPTLKLNGTFLSIITLGFSEMIRLIALNWMSLTQGPLGLKGIPALKIFGITVKSGAPFYYLTLFFLLMIVFILNRLLHSRIGRAWISLREDQDAARSLGIKVSYYRCINFMIGATICGMMGTFYAFNYRYLHPDSFSLDEGFSVLSMCVIGGSGTLLGPIVGAFIINILTEGFRFASDWRMVIYALLIIVMMWVRPQGLFGAKDSVIAGKAVLLPNFFKHPRNALKIKGGMDRGNHS